MAGRAVRQGPLARHERLRAVLLVAPLVLYLGVAFIWPITTMLMRGVTNEETATLLVKTGPALAGWDGHAAPGPEAYDALVADIAGAEDRFALALAGKRLNLDMPGFQSLMRKTVARLGGERPEDPRAALVAIDDRWATPEPWGALRTAAPAVTPFYLLAALDLRRDPTGEIGLQPEYLQIYQTVWQRTLWITAVVTGLCLLLGYPLAYTIATARPLPGQLLMICVLLPFWTSLLVRTTAWTLLLQTNGVVNDLFIALGIWDEPVQLVYNRPGVYIAMTHVLLPFMVLPLVAVMKGIPHTYMQAASSLGAPPFRAFLRVYLPQTMPGVAAGILLVSMIGIGFYITPELVGGPADQMISYFAASFAQSGSNWGLAAALSLMLLLAALVMYLLFEKLAGRDALRAGR